MYELGDSMLESGEMLDLLKNIPQGYLVPDDELFTASKVHLLNSYKKLGAIGNCELQDIEKETPSSLSSTNMEIFCNVLGCGMIFDSVCAYQSHYNTMHRYKCSECRKCMPTEHLLDIHISEQHDFFFKTRVEKGERLHKCYLEECQELFFNPLERKEHCIKEHKFPSNFRFDKMGRRNLTNKESSSKGQLQLDLGMVVGNKKEYKFISFGHQEKTFSRTVSKQIPEHGKTLEKMDTLKDALDSI